VVEYQPWRRPLVIAAVGLIGAVCMVVGYGLGNRHVVTHAIERAELTQSLQAAQGRLAEQEAALIDARLAQQVQQTAANTLREDLTDAHQNVARLQEEVTFYKGLMAPSSLSRGRQVADLELLQLDGGGSYSYQLLLTQVALRRSYIAGEVRMDVIGQYEDSRTKGEAVLSLTELSDTEAYPLKFRFRYFQDFAGRLTLPEGFTPEKVLVTANQSGKDPLQVTFPWPATAIPGSAQDLAMTQS